MADIRPFRGVRPRPEVADQIISPPYDVVDVEEGRAYVRDRPHSFLRVVKPEIEFDPGLEVLDAQIFARGAANLDRMRAEGLMTRDPTPCLYLYRQQMGRHVQTGLVAGTSVAEYNDGRIKKHEHTRADKEEERTRHVDTLGANTGPVFLTYRAVPAIDALVQQHCAGVPVVDLTTEDGVGHTFWVVDDPDDVAALGAFFDEVPHLYVADGHHRSAAAARVQALRAQRNPLHTGEEPYNWFLSVIFPHDQMMIMEYNRVVLDLGGHTEAGLLEAVAEKFEVWAADHARPDKAGDFGMFLGGRWYRLRARPGTWPADDPVQSLDVAILQNNLLRPLLGIEDPRTDKRIHFVGGIRGTGELERRAAACSGVAFALFPTRIEQLMAVADAGDVMPPKSTWFEPKLRSGMVVRLIDE